MGAGRKRILIVDDDADLRRGLVLLLGREYEILEAGDGPSCQRVLAETSPHILLLDVAMPGMTGIEVLRSARAIGVVIPVLMLTAQADLELARQALDLGANAYITKPFDFGDLRREVKRLLEGPSREEKDHDYRPWRVNP
ncbi:MAG: response regulator [Elusimicrobia bacterium]|nr:response regulator [Elusimicrobiota bacterium]